MTAKELPRRWEAVILAAGASRRMGFPKALLEWGGAPLVVTLAKELCATRVAKSIVVLGAQERLVRQAFAASRGFFEEAARREGRPGRARVELVTNPRWAAGKTTSIRAGVEKLSEAATDLLLLTVDQPLRAEVMESVMGAHEALNAAATVPAYGGRRGHPVALSLCLRDELTRLSEEEEGLKGLVRRLEAQGRLAVYELGAPCVLWNFNRPQDVPPWLVEDSGGFVPGKEEEAGLAKICMIGIGRCASEERDRGSIGKADDRGRPAPPPARPER